MLDAILVTQDDIKPLGRILGFDMKVMIADTEFLSNRLELGLNKYEVHASRFTDQKQSFWE